MSTEQQAYARATSIMATGVSGICKPTKYIPSARDEEFLKQRKRAEEIFQKSLDRGLRYRKKAIVVSVHDAS